MPSPTIRSRAIGCGAYLPPTVVSNDELAKRIDTSDEWITRRTGIKQRHVVEEGQSASHLAIAASKAALEHAGVDGSEVDLIVLATSTPDHTFPATAVQVQAAIGAVGGAAFDVQAACTGFIYALSIADQFIKTGQSKCALVVGSEVFSKLLDWNDRGTCVLFGDGAGALLLQASTVDDPFEDQPGLISTHLHADGRFLDLLYVDGGAGTTQSSGTVKMEGREVFRHAVDKLAAVVDETLEVNGLAKSDIDWLVPHQANVRIIDAMGRKLGLSDDRVVKTVDRHANTSAASIPLALTEVVRDGRLKPGDLVLMEAIGGGLTWGAGLLRW
ncbi:MAG: beta-ketoacyl-ACP synthase III [Pseudomonadota bacterium]